VNGRWVLLFVGATVSVVVLNGTMLPVALPRIGRELSLSTAQVGWLVTGYFLVLGVAVPFFGRLADLYGVGRLYAVGLVTFLLGSAVCALAPDYPMLLAGRLLQSLGAAAVAGLGPTAVSLAYSSERRGGALGAVNAAAGAAAALGPVLGGILTNSLGWRYLFVPGVLFGALAPLAPKALPRGEIAGGERLDWAGGLLLGAAVGGSLLALTRGAEGDWASQPVLWSSGAAMVAAAAFVVRQRTARSPFVSRLLLGERSYVHLGAITLLLIGIYLTVESIVPLPLSDVRGLSPARIGLVLLPPALLNAAWGAFAGKVVDRYGVRAPLLAATAAVVLALLALSVFGVGGPVWRVSAMIAVILTGGTLARVAIVKGVSLVTPQEHLSSGISINDMVWMVGVSIGTALFVATATAREDAPGSLNPFYSGEFVGYSDAFLLLTVPLLAALLISSTLPKRRPGP
jgi:MFS family permease